MLTRRRFIGGCAAGLALAPAARLSAQILPAGGYCALDLPASSVYVKTGYALTCIFYFGKTEIARATYSGGRDGIATLPARLVSFPPGDREFSLQMETVRQSTGTTASGGQKRPITTISSQFTSTIQGTGLVGGLHAVGETVRHTPATGGECLAFRVRITPLAVS